jgi:hypothetical protein
MMWFASMLAAVLVAAGDQLSKAAVLARGPAVAPAARRPFFFSICCVLNQRGALARSMTFVHLAASKLLGGRLRVPDRGQQGCISLIVRALQQVGVPFERAATDMSVVDLAKRFGVRP